MPSIPRPPPPPPRLRPPHRHHLPRLRHQSPPAHIPTLQLPGIARSVRHGKETYLIQVVRHGVLPDIVLDVLGDALVAVDRGEPLE
jgi:hypothetical protein